MRQQEPKPRGDRPRRRWRIRRIALSVLVVVVLGLVAARIALPWYVQSYVNRVIDQSTEYDGRIGGIDVSLWRGAYQIHDIELVKTTNAVPVPFFSSPRVDVSISWRSLWKGLARGEVVMYKPQINFVHGPTSDETQTGADQPWLQILNDLSPFRLDRAEVRDGEVHFSAFHTSPNVEIYLTDVNGAITNLTNAQDKLDPLVAEVHAKGKAMDDAPVELDMEFDPQSYRPSFTLAVRLLNLDVTRLNSLSLAYGGFDFEYGYFDFVLEAAAEDGFLEGNVKPLFRDLDIASLSELREDGLLRTVWESALEAIQTILKNQQRNQFGTSFAVRGDLDDPRASLVQMVGNVLRNAFVRAYLPRLEGVWAPEATAEAP